MSFRKRIAAVVLACVLAFGGVARADSNEPDPTHDARTEGYQNPMQISGSTALIWILFLVLAIISMSALFKDSRRARTE